MQNLSHLKIAIKKALLRLNNGERVSDFLDILQDECKQLELHTKCDDIANTLQKALMLLKYHNIIDFSCDLPLEKIDSKLSLLLENTKELLAIPQNSPNILSFLNENNAKKDILLCKISQKTFIKKLDSATREKLLKTMCDLFVTFLDKKGIVGIYKDSIVILPKISHKNNISEMKSHILDILQHNTFMFHNKPLRLQVDFVVKKFGQLK